MPRAEAGGVAAITGATGFIGAAIARYLLERGWGVRALCRSTDGSRRLASLGAEPVAGSLADVGALRRLARGADAVIHCAGTVRGATYRDFEVVNVDGTDNLLKILDAEGPPLVALSSLAAREPSLSHYARSKRAMEDLLGAPQAPRHRLVLRPPAVYGPGDRELMALFRALARGWAPLPAPAHARVSMLYVSDLAAAVHAWLRSSERASGVFELHDGHAGGYSWDEVVATAERLLGRGIRRMHLPAGPLRLWSHTNAACARLLGYAPMLTPGKLAELRHADWVCDNRAFAATVAWQPRVQLAQGLQMTCGWGQAA